MRYLLISYIERHKVDKFHKKVKKYFFITENHDFSMVNLLQV